MQTSSPPVITPNRSQSNPDDVITLPRPIQSVGMNLHNVSGTSTGQTLPRETRAPPGTHFCPTIGWVYPHAATIFILHPLLSTFSSTFVRNIPTCDNSNPSIFFHRNDDSSAHPGCLYLTAQQPERSAVIVLGPLFLFYNKTQQKN